jgi:hypothetical protein
VARRSGRRIDATTRSAVCRPLRWWAVTVLATMVGDEEYR